jgi:hypothetical protein
VIGWFLVQAALRYDPAQARGMAEALRTIAQHAYGRWMLAAVALGLSAFGVLSLVDARYRRVT